MAFDHRTSLKTLSDTVIDSQTLADNDFLIFNASDSKWYNRSTSTSRTKMGVAIGTDVQAHDAALDSLALVSSATGNIIVGAGGGGWTAESGNKESSCSIGNDSRNRSCGSSKYNIRDNIYFVGSWWWTWWTKT